MRKQLMVAAAAFMSAVGPALAAPDVAIVMLYKFPDGGLRHIAFTVTEGLSFADCHEDIDLVLPELKQRVARDYDAFDGARFVEAKCEAVTNG